jgi:hypothetical protein
MGLRDMKVAMSIHAESREGFDTVPTVLNY